MIAKALEQDVHIWKQNYEFTWVANRVMYHMTTLGKIVAVECKIEYKHY